MTTPKDIIERAEKKYPKPDRSDYHTEMEYDYALIGSHRKTQRDTYIAAKVEERAEMMEFISWIKEYANIQNDRRWTIDCEEQNNKYTDSELHTYWIENVKSKTV